MKKSYRNALLIVVGCCILFVVVAVAGGIWFFVSHLESASADAVTAEKSFEEIRRRFADRTPVMRIVDREIELLRKPPDGAPSRDVKNVQGLVWNPEDDRLARFTLPMWLLRMSDDPIEMTVNAGELANLDISMTAADIARYGPTLVVDHVDEDGERILVWTD